MHTSKCSHLSGHDSTRAQPLGRSCRLRPAKIQRSFGKRTPCKAGTAVADPRSRSLQDMHISIPGITSAGQVLAAGLAKHLQTRSQLPDDWQPLASSSQPQAVMPKAPPEWTPPTDPSGPTAPPEFTPPRDPGSVPGTVPEFEPPEQAPPGRTRPADPPSPGRPARPEPDEIPDPERDPLRTPERRRETGDPDETDPSPEPETAPASQNLMEAVHAYVQDCQEVYDYEDSRGGGISIGLGPNNCPAVLLWHPTGYTATVNMHGANVTSWRRPDGLDILHMRPDSPFNGTSPILGGIPLVFPQYGRASGVAAYAGVGNPAVPTHGFLSHLHWTLVDAGGSDPDAEDPCPTVVLEAESTTETYAVWPYHFRAVYTVSLMFTDDEPQDPLLMGPEVRPRFQSDYEEQLEGSSAPEPAVAMAKRSRGRPAKSGKWQQLSDKGTLDTEEAIAEQQQEEDERNGPVIAPTPVQLKCTLEILNEDDKPFSFEAALQSHVGTHEVRLMEALGFKGKLMLNCDASPDRPLLRMCDEESSTYGETQVDRVYLDAATQGKGPVYVAPGHNEFLLEYMNRGGFRDMGVWNPLAELPDPSLHRNFVTYASGAIARPVKLKPQEAWVGEMVIRLHEATSGSLSPEDDGTGAEE
ncbi:g4449 [Coccomyxa viridis]|uniref:G4449 protein n=1 Tax=Coccomyxa viridis TaxID=1274662 RepID=A0ABP1FQA7_9CHLO